MFWIYKLYSAKWYLFNYCTEWYVLPHSLNLDWLSQTLGISYRLCNCHKSDVILRVPGDLWSLRQWSAQSVSSMLGGGNICPYSPHRSNMPIFRSQILLYFGRMNIEVYVALSYRFVDKPWALGAAVLCVFRVHRYVNFPRLRSRYAVFYRSVASLQSSSNYLNRLFLRLDPCFWQYQFLMLHL